jgi:hypothetical protein
MVGWKFKVVDNRPTSVSKGAVRLPDTAAEDEKRRVQRSAFSVQRSAFGVRRRMACWILEFG